MGRKLEIHTKSIAGNMKIRYHLGERENRERIIEQEIIKIHHNEQSVRMWTRITYLRMRFSINPII
jgi:hypothetical protein